MSAESQAWADPESLVAVWGANVLLVHFTVVPTLTVKVGGAKLKTPEPTILTALWPPVDAVVAVGAVVDVAAGGTAVAVGDVLAAWLEVLPHPASTTTSTMKTPDTSPVQALSCRAYARMSELLVLLRRRNAQDPRRRPQSTSGYVPGYRIGQHAPRLPVGGAMS